MRISTYNIDWAKKYSNKSHIKKIEEILLQTNSDIIIITESVDSLVLANYNYAYKTHSIPLNIDYEGINYVKYLNGEIANRVAIYSKYECIDSFPVIDTTTSICRRFNTEIGSLTIYATIIGTRFNKKPYAENELNNCIADCLKISNLTSDLCIIGDLNTSFIETEVYHEIKGINSRQALVNLCKNCGIDLTTKEIAQNIDHILLPKEIAKSHKIESKVFIEKDTLSDHKGILVDITRN